MIRFRIGQTWKSEATSAPHDAFGLDIDGIALISGAENEPLTEVVPALLEAIWRLSMTGSAQLSLPESHTELCFFATGAGITLHIVQLSRPARLLRAPITLDFQELCRAATVCGKKWLSDMESHALHSPWAAHTVASLKKSVRQLQSVPSEMEVREPAGSGISYRSQPVLPPSLGFHFLDPLERLCSYRPLATGALSSLLLEGAIDFKATGQSEYILTGYPILLMTELSRQALELTQAYLRKEPRWESKLAGIGPLLTVDLESHSVEVEKQRIVVDVKDFIKILLQAPLALRFAFVSLHSPQAHNPYLLQLAHQSHEALAHLRTVTPHTFDVMPRDEKKTQNRPLQLQGRLKKLRFDLQWEQPLPTNAAYSMKLSSAGPIVASGARIYAFSKKGKLRYLHDSVDSCVVTADEELLIQRGNTLWGFGGPSLTAQWSRPSEDTHLGPFFTRLGNTFLVQINPHALSAIDVASGHQRWGWSALRQPRSSFAVIGQHIVCATDTGLLVGLHSETGALLYQQNFDAALTHAPVAFGRNWLVLGKLGSSSTLISVFPGQSLAQWRLEIPASSLSSPLVHLKTCWLTGVNDGRPTLYSITGAGQLAWERKLPLSGRKLNLVPTRRGVIVTDGQGAAVRISVDNSIAWRLGGTGDELEHNVPPIMSRGILLVPGQCIQAIEPEAGQTLATVPIEQGVNAMTADSRMRLFALNESGALSAFHLTSHLSLL